MRTLNNNPTGTDSINVAHLIRLKYWDGGAEQEIRLTDAVDTLDIDLNTGNNVETWQGTGLLFSIAMVEESSDLDAPGVDIVFDGVDQSIISIIMNNDFRGREAEVWRVWLDPALGTQVATANPVQLFSGLQNEAYTITESFNIDDPNAVVVGTRLVGSISRVSDQSNVLSSTISHNEMNERAGLATGDTFFQNIPVIDGVEIFWGRKGPLTPYYARPADRSGGSPSLPGGEIVPQGPGA